MRFPRLMPALITPFRDNGDVDLNAHTHNLDLLGSKGIEGFVLGGSNGEGPFLESGERRLLVATSKAYGFAVVGIWAESVRMAVSQVEEASEADAVLVTTPTTLVRSNVEAQIRFFTEVADGSPVPVLLYSVPMNTGYHLDEAAVAVLAGHPNIVGMKDSGADAVRIQRILASTGPDFTLFNGASVSVLLAMRAGAYGAITGSVNYIPEQMLTLISAIEGDRSIQSGPLALQNDVSRVTAAVERHGIPGVKVAARLAGLRPGFVRSPLAQVDQSVELIIKTALEGI